MASYRWTALLALVIGLLFSQAATAQTPDTASFAAFPAVAYAGPRAQPSFTGAQRRFRLYRSAIRDGFRDSALFAGHYVLIAIGCGTDCLHAYVGDVKTGAVWDFPFGGEANWDLDWQTSPTSTLVLVRWNAGIEDGPCQNQDLVWTGHAFTKRPLWTTPHRCARFEPD